MQSKIDELVEITAVHGNYKGTIMPNSNDEVLFLKLHSGYNIGIDKKKIKKIKSVPGNEEIKKKSEKTMPVAKIKQKNGLPTIAILHTGGTLASKVDYKTGGVISKFKPEELVSMFPELSKIANIKSVFISNMFSDQMTFDNYIKIARAALKEIKSGVKGIIIGHGTDTMHYTAAALSFMFEHLPIPILLVGAQRSSDRGSTDAAMNMICAVEFMNKTDFHGVAICMHDSESDDKCAILPATKTRKIHTSRRDAFKTINDKPIANVDYNTRTIEIFKKIEKEKPKEVILKHNLEKKVGLLKIYPNMNSSSIKAFKGYKGLVIEGTGLGHLPITQSDENKKIFNELKKLIKSGCIVVMASQCIFGSVNMNVYSIGRDLLEIGVIPAEDMLAETAYVKLAWLLANHKKDARTLIRKNLRGELKERLLPEEFLSQHDFDSPNNG